MLNLSEARSWLPPDLQGRVQRPYYLPLTTAAALGAGATTTLSTSFQNVSAFLIIAIVGRVYTVAAPQTSLPDPGLTVQVQFSSGDDMTFGAVPWSAIIQSAIDPNPGQSGLIAPRLVPGGSNISITLADYDATAYLIRLALCGLNIYST